jgi:hypothetical protein
MRWSDGQSGVVFKRRHRRDRQTKLIIPTGLLHSVPQRIIGTVRRH